MNTLVEDDYFAENLVVNVEECLELGTSEHGFTRVYFLSAVVMHDKSIVLII